ncbi:MAG: hypothetical protein M0010_18605 [Actinomycetota bacterium]|nr:hypothetical protein [Actinomycetota bacterium]
MVRVPGITRPPARTGAWQVYELESRPDGSVGGVCATNDDEDRGCPGTFALWSVHYANRQAALAETGGCHFGCFGDVKVSVVLDGVLVDRDGNPVEGWGL